LFKYERNEGFYPQTSPTSPKTFGTKGTLLEGGCHLVLNGDLYQGKIGFQNPFPQETIAHLKDNIPPTFSF